MLTESFKYLSFTLVRYSIAVALFFAIGAAAAFFIAPSRKIAGSAIFILTILVSTYGVLLIYPGFAFFGLVRTGAATSEKIVAFTFDDGPSRKYTPEILDVLKENGAHATFFMLGESAARNSGLVERIVREGHLAANHTYGHHFLLTKSAGDRKSEISRTHELIKSITGAQMKYFRAPYEYKDLRLLLLLRRMDYEYVGHGINSGDVTAGDADKVVSRILNGLRPGGIILMHDSRGNRQATVDALRRVLPEMRKRGYRAVTVEELPGE